MQKINQIKNKIFSTNYKMPNIFNIKSTNLFKLNLNSKNYSNQNIIRERAALNTEFGEIDPLKAKLVSYVSLVNKLVQDNFKKANPELETDRRAALNNQSEYRKLAIKSQEAMREASKTSVEELKKQFRLSLNERDYLIDHRQAIEKERYRMLNPKFEANILPDITTAKSALEFLRATESKLKESVVNNTSLSKQERDQENAINKFYVTDSLYVKYKLSRDQLQFLQNKYKLE